MPILLTKILFYPNEKTRRVPGKNISKFNHKKNDAIKTKHNEIALCTLCISPFLPISFTRHRKLLRVSKPLVLLIIKNAYSALLHRHSTQRTGKCSIRIIVLTEKTTYIDLATSSLHS